VSGRHHASAALPPGRRWEFLGACVDGRENIAFTVIRRPDRPASTESLYRLRHPDHQLMLYKEIITVCSEIHTKHINTLCGQNVEFVNVKPGVTYSNLWFLKNGWP
jgi:hypothetical protein